MTTRGSTQQGRALPAGAGHVHMLWKELRSSWLLLFLPWSYSVRFRLVFPVESVEEAFFFLSAVL